MLHLVKRERPCATFADLRVLNAKRASRKFRKINFEKILQTPTFIFFLSHCSTDASLTEKVLIYLLYLCDGTSTNKYLSREEAKYSDAIVLQASIEKTFQ